MDAIGDWLLTLEDPRALPVRLAEAYYSIACDYLLAWYLQWPYYRRWHEDDVFEPYFELWRRGISCRFIGDEMVLGRLQ